MRPPVRPLKPATVASVANVAQAVALLKTARDLLAREGCDLAAGRVRLAISSADGALRHVRRRADATAAAQEEI